MLLLAMEPPPEEFLLLFLFMAMEAHMVSQSVVLSD